MTKPDEALLYAREHWANICDEDGFSDEAEAYRRGVKDESLATDALFYRAGAAASEARIKALKEALRDALPQLEGCFWQHTWHSEQPREPEYLVNIRALLKEADQ